MTLLQVLSAAALVPAISTPLSSQTWIKRAPGTSPSVRYAHASVYDTARGHVLLFGGSDADNNLRDDTWTWNGSDWTAASPTTSPTARRDHGMCYDSVRLRVVLFGGGDRYGRPMGDTWEWNGTTWNTVSPSGTQPSARYAQGMAYSETARVTVLFGGALSPTGPTLNDTWTWDGDAWTHIPTTTQPSSRSSQMCYDHERANIVLFGGYDGTNFLADTWIWDDREWSQTNLTKPAPSARSSAALTYDNLRKRVVLFGGIDHTGVFNDSWEWDGKDWSQVTPTDRPSIRYGATLAYDIARCRSVLFGGRTAFPGGTTLNETWEFGLPPADASFSPFGAGCPGTNGVPLLASSAGPWLGERFTTTITNLPSNPLSVPFGLLGFSDKMWGGVGLPLDLGLIGMDGCDLLVSIASSTVLQNVGGTATWSLPIPRLCSLISGAFFQQVLVLDAAANAFGATVSNGAQAIIGLR